MLAPCLDCDRHIRRGICPFCGSLRRGEVARLRYRDLTRAAIFVAGAMAGCGGTEDPAPEEETIMQPYGAPPLPPPEETPNPDPDGPQVPPEGEPESP